MRDGRATADMLRGAAAGAIGTVAMDLITWPMYGLQSKRTRTREKRARIRGKPAGQVAAEKVARRIGWKPSPRGRRAAGQAIHLLMGVVPAMAYAGLRRRYPRLRAGRGLLFGAAVFLLIDELATPLSGVASGPRRYPWQTHLRGLVGHLAFGLATEAALAALTNQSERWSRPRAATWSRQNGRSASAGF